MRLVPVLLLATLVGACAPPRAVDVRIGEACWRCRRPILKAVLAAEYVAPTTGFASKFRTIHCMATWIAQQQDAPQSGVFYVRNYATNTWIPAERAVYVRTVVNPGTNERDYMAFEAADEITAARVGAAAEAPVSWQAVLAMGRAHPLGGD